MPLDPQAEPLVAAQAGMQIDQLTPEIMRAATAAGAAPIQREIARVFDRTIPGPGGDIPVRFYSELEPNEVVPALVFLHGSGFVIGGLDSHDNFCREFAARGRIAVLSVDYRLAPEHKFPAATEDAYAAVSWLAQNGQELDIDESRLAVGGDSAGGNLAAVVALMARDRGGPKLLHQLLMYPVLGGPNDSRRSYEENAAGYGLTPAAMQWFMDHYTRTPADLDNPYVCPIRADDLSGLPPATILTAEYDVLRDEGEEYGRRLAEAGVPCTVSRYDGEPHGFMSMVGAVARASDAFEECSTALNAALLGTA
jgi:acetyl esterase